MSNVNQTELTQDEIFELLSSSRRRFILYYLNREQRPVELGELASEIAAWENDTTVEQLTRQQRKRVYVSLYQTHIPKMEDAGLITYDAETGVLELARQPTQIRSILGDEENDIPWQRYYLLLAAISFGIYIADLLDLWIFAQIPTVAIGIAIIAVFAVTAIAHYVYNRRRRMRPSLTLTDLE